MGLCTLSTAQYKPRGTAPWPLLTCTSSSHGKLMSAIDILCPHCSKKRFVALICGSVLLFVIWIQLSIMFRVLSQVTAQNKALVQGSIAASSAKNALFGGSRQARDGVFDVEQRQQKHPQPDATVSSPVRVVRAQSTPQPTVVRVTTPLLSTISESLILPPAPLPAAQRTTMVPPAHRHGFPRLLHMMWKTGRPPSRKMDKMFTETWRQTNPGWKLKIWSDDGLDTYLRSALAPEVSPNAGRSARNSWGIPNS